MSVRQLIVCKYMIHILAYACLFSLLVKQSQGRGDEKSSAPSQFLPLTQNIVDKFHSLSWNEKVPYIFTENEWREIAKEFQLISGTLETNKYIGYEKFVDHFEEFSDPLQVIKFWQECDSDVDRRIDLMEYVHCRGDFDQNGEPYDINEYEFREANILASFEPIVQYDEDGIIID